MSIKNNTASLQEILNTINELPEAGSSGEQATPVIDVNASGLITATAGTKTSTYQLAFQAAKTITPNTTNQIAVSSGYYTGGNITVKGDSNLVADNIKKGVSIFDVSGTYEGSGMGEINLQDKTITENGTYTADSEYDGLGTVVVDIEGGDIDHSVEDGLITGNVSGIYTNDRVKTIRNYAFYRCSSLASINFPVCTRIGSSAFYNCSSLASINFPVCTSIGSSAFYNCSSLTLVNFPVCRSIDNHAFYSCSSLTSINFPVCTSIGSSAFYNCSSLASINFPVCTSIGSNAFYNCRSLASINFPVCTSIGNSAFKNCLLLTSALFGSDIPSTSTTIKAYIYQSAFYSCSKLINLTLYYPSVATLSNVNAFTSTPMSPSTLTGLIGSIYVPASLVNAYKSATNWVTYADRITAISDQSQDGTIVFYIATSPDENPLELTANNGMTWGEWIESEYNTHGIEIDFDGAVLMDSMYIYSSEDDNQVYQNSLIYANASYYLL